MPLNTKRLLITGGAGFIGSNAVHYFLKNKKYSIGNIDKLTYAGNLESLKSLKGNPNYEFFQADICDKDKMKSIIDGFRPEAILHLAAESHVDRSIDGPSSFIQTNIVGTASLLEATYDYWSKLSDSLKNRFRFLHVSTDEVFGSLGPSGFFDEKTAYDPRSPYSASKASSDHLVRAWRHTYGLPTLITNCSNNYGPFQFPEKLIPVVILNALLGNSIPVYGKGDNIRDWLYVEDHIRALDIVLDHGDVGETYLIGGHNEVTNLNLVNEICDALTEIRPKPTSYKDLIQFVADRPGHDKRYAIDPSKIEQKLGWKPLTSYKEGMRKTIRWYLENDEWIKSCKKENIAERLGLEGQKK